MNMISIREITLASLRPGKDEAGKCRLHFLSFQALLASLLT
jgi:hypothetical protein